MNRDSLLFDAWSSGYIFPILSPSPSSPFLFQTSSLFQMISLHLLLSLSLPFPLTLTRLLHSSRIPPLGSLPQFLLSLTQNLVRNSFLNLGCRSRSSSLFSYNHVPHRSSRIRGLRSLRLGEFVETCRERRGNVREDEEGEFV